MEGWFCQLISRKDKWNQAVGEENQSPDDNETYEIVRKPREQRIIGCKWIFTLEQQELQMVNSGKSTKSFRGSSLKRKSGAVRF